MPRSSYDRARIASPPPRRQAGWWGIAFVVLVFVQGALVSLPAASRSGAFISQFYAAHGTLIAVQQVLGVAALIAFVGFALALGARRSRLLLLAAALLIVTELATNVVPLILVVDHSSAELAHALTVVEDLADAALFLAIAFFSVAATLGRAAWLRTLGVTVAVVSLGRAVLSPLGVEALDVVAPLAFAILILLICLSVLTGRRR